MQETEKISVRIPRSMVNEAIKISGVDNISYILKEALGEYIMNHRPKLDVLVERLLELEKEAQIVREEIGHEKDLISKAQLNKGAKVKTEEEERLETVKGNIMRQLNVMSIEALFASKNMGVYMKHLKTDNIEEIKDLVISLATKDQVEEYTLKCRTVSDRESSSSSSSSSSSIDR